MSELARRVRERRAALGLSQEELADRMGYRSKSSITKLEKGVNDLPQSKLEELAAALDTTPAWLLGIETAVAPPPGFEPLPEMARVPLVGSIACGTPITAEQNIESYIAAVRIGDEATLKHFHRQGSTVMLLADNAAVCPPMIYAGSQLEEIQIEGRAVGFCRGL